MSAIASSIEQQQEVRPGVFGERAQELGTVVSRYLPMFYKRAFRFLGNTTDAEDVVQDALLSAYKHLGQFRGQAQLSTWLTTIVTNAARMQLRRRRGSYLSLDEEQGEDGLTFSERLPDLKPSPEEVCVTAEARDRLVDGVKQLSPKLRQAFQLRDIDGLTTKEAALVLGVPQGTVKAQLARARAKLAGIIRAKPVRQRSRTGSLREAVSAKGPSREMGLGRALRNSAFRLSHWGRWGFHIDESRASSPTEENFRCRTQCRKQVKTSFPAFLTGCAPSAVDGWADVQKSSSVKVNV